MKKLSIFAFVIVLITSTSVFGQLVNKPDWTNPSGYQNTMTIHGQVQYLDASFVATLQSMLAAFKDGECRGVFDIMQGPAGWQFILAVASNEVAESGFVYKVYDAGKDQVYTLNETHDFAINATLGSIGEPIIFTVPPGSDATLSDIKVDGTTVAGFDPATLTYGVELPYGTTVVPTVTTTTTDMNANAVVTPAASLPGTTSVLVTAEDGTTTQTYNVNFTIALNNDASLSNLQVDGNTVAGFDQGIFVYDIELTVGTTIVPTVTGTPTDPNAGAVVTPAASLPGTTTVNVTAEDGTTTQAYEVNFTLAPNFDPVIQDIGLQTMPENSRLNRTVTFTDQNLLDTHTITVVSDQPNVIIENLSGNTSGSTYDLVSKNDWFGPANITVTVTDIHGGFDTEVYQLTVTSVNYPPKISDVGNQTTPESTTKPMTVNFTDQDPLDQHTIDVASDEPNVTVANLSGILSGSTYDLIPAANWFGTANITVTVTDDSGEGNNTDTEIFTLTVTSVNFSPEIDPIGPLNTPEETPLNLTIDYSDNDPLDNHTVEVQSDNVNVQITELSVGGANGGIGVSAALIGQKEYLMTPAVNWYGIANITVIVTDDSGEGNDTGTYRFVLTVINVNDPPVLTEIGPQATTEESNKTLAFVYTDPDLVDSHIVTVVSDNPKVSVQNKTGNTSGSTYDLVPEANFTGTATITVTVTDNSGEANDTDFEQYLLTVTNQNDSPILTDIGNQSTPEDTPLQLAVNFIDNDNEDTHLITVVSGNPQVTVENISGNTTGSTYDLVPALNFNGTANITVTVADQIGANDFEIFTLTVTAVNDPPVVDPVPEQVIDEGEVFTNLDLNAIVSDPETPDNLIIWTHNIDVGPVVPPNIEVSIIDGIASVTVLDEDWHGGEIVTFTAEDEGGLTDNVMVQYTVNPVNDTPVITTIPGQTINEGEQFQTLDLNASVDDVDNTDQEMTWTYTGNTDLGIGIVNGIATITIPNPNWNGFETITFTAKDPGLESASGAATFTVNAENDQPVVTDIPDQQFAEGTAFNPVNLDGFVSDEESPDNKISWTYAGNSELIVNITNRIATITAPNENWNGTETITFTAYDEGGLTDSDDAVFTLTPVNDDPVISDIPGESIAEGGTFTKIHLDPYILDNETPDDQIVWTQEVVVGPGAPPNLNVNIIDGIATITYIDEEWNGSETIRFTATDGGGTSVFDDAEFTVTAVNDPPVVTDIPNQSRNEGEVFSDIQLDNYVNDIEDRKAVNWTHSPSAHYTIVITNRVASIVPVDPDWNGFEVITFTATDNGVPGDGVGLTDSDEVRLTVIAVNDPPAITEILPQTVPEGSPFIQIELDNFVNDNETTDDFILWTTSLPTNLIININNRNATITPKNENWNGNETIRFTARDEGGLTAFWDVLFTVTPVNDIPVVDPIPDQEVEEGTPFTRIDLNGFVEDVETLDANIIWTHGLVVGPGVPPFLDVAIANGIATITPFDPNWNGTETISFTAEDEGNETASVNVSFTITPVNDPPVVTDIPDQQLAEGAAFAQINLDDYVSDNEDNDDQITWSYAGNIMLTVDITGRIAIVTPPNPDWNGAETVTFTATDLGGLTHFDDATFTLTPVNDPPIVTTAMGTKNKQEDFGQFIIDLNNVFSDPDGENLTYTLENTDPAGVVTANIQNANELSINSILDVSGTVQLTLRGTDGDTEFVEDILTLNVSNSNDPPIVTTPMGLVQKNEDFDPFSIDLNTVFTDNDGESLTYTLEGTTGTSVQAALSGSTLDVSAVLNGASDGNTVTVRGTDGFGSFIDDVLTVNVAPVNDQPVINSQVNVNTPEDTPVEIIPAHLNVVDPDNTYPDDFSLTITGGDNYTIAGNTVIPNLDFVGLLTVPVVVNDGALDSDPFNLAVNVDQVNDKPVLLRIGNQAMDEESRLNLMFEFTDGDIGNTHTISVTSDEPNVTIENKSGDLTGSTYDLVPAADWFGTANITVLVTDDSGADNNSDQEIYVLTVRNVNDPPIINTQVVDASTQNQPYTFDFNFTDIDSPELTFTLLDYPAWLTCSNGTAQITVAVVDNNATATIQGTPGPTSRSTQLNVKVSDGEFNPASSFLLTVNLINYPPVAENSSTETDEDVAKILTLPGSDNETTYVNLSFAITNQPDHGTLVQNGAENLWTYTPDLDYFGPDFFEYSVTDDDATPLSTNARVDITVNYINDNPVIGIADREPVMNENTVLDIQLNMDDVKDGVNASQLGRSMVYGPFNGTIVENIPLTIGNAQILPAAFKYVPNPDFVGTDVIVVRAAEIDSDEMLFSTDLAIEITVQNVNVAPFAHDKIFSLLEDDQVNFDITAADDVDDLLALVYEIVAPPLHSSIFNLTGNTITYKPVANWDQSDTFTFRTQDTEGEWSNTATVQLNITAINDVPVALGTTISAGGGSSVIFDFTGLIDDPETADEDLTIDFILTTFGLPQAIQGGKVTHISGTLWEFDENGSGALVDYVPFRISDGEFTSDIVNLIFTNINIGNSISEGGVNDPLALGDNYNIDLGQTVEVKFTGIDVLSPFVQSNLTITTDPTKGTLADFQISNHDELITTYTGNYTPTVLINGPVAAPIEDSIKFQVVSDDGTSEGWIHITINVVDIPPVVSQINNVEMNEDNPNNINIGYADLDTDPANLTWTFTSTPAVPGLNFTIQPGVASPAEFVVTLPLNYAGASNIAVELKDDTGLTDNMEFRLTVNGSNDPPVLVAITNNSTPEDTPITMNLSASDIDTDEGNLSFSATSVPPSAITSFDYNGNALTINPAQNYIGNTQITVTVSDNENPALTDQEIFTLDIQAENDPPVLDPIVAPVPVNEDEGTIDVNIEPTDIDQGDQLSVSINSSDNILFPNGSITVTPVQDGTGVQRIISLDPAPDVSGTSLITVSVTDNEATVVQQFMATVNPVNDAPVISNIGPVVMEENTTVQIQILASDIDSPVLNYNANSNNTDIDVQVINNANNYILEIEAKNNFNGQSQVNLIVDDGAGGVTNQVVNITITEVDQIPVVVNPINDVSVWEDSDVVIIDLTNVFTDVDNDDGLIVFSLDSNNNGALVNAVVNGNQLTLTFAADQTGLSSITIKGTSNNKSAYDVFKVMASPVDDPPVVLNPINNVTVDQDSPDTFIDVTNVFTDVDNDDALIVKTIQNNNNSTLVNVAIIGNQLSISYMAEQFGVAQITVRGTSNLQFVDNTFTVTVNSTVIADEEPVVANPIDDFNVNEDSQSTIIDLSNVFTDPDNNDADIIKTVDNNSNVPLVAATIVGNTLTLDYQSDVFGQATITIKANSNGKTVDEIFVVTVLPVDDYPVIINNIPNLAVFEDADNSLINLNNRFTDIDNDDNNITVTLANNTNPLLLAGSISNGVLILDYLPNANGVTTLTIRAMSNGKQTDESFIVTVIPVDDVPVLAQPLQDFVFDEDNPLTTVDISAVITDVDTYVFLAVDQNSDESIVDVQIAGHEMSIICQPNMFGVVNIVISGSSGLTLYDTFSITVNPIDDPPAVINEIPDVDVYMNAPNFTYDISNVFNDIDNDNALIVSGIFANSNTGIVAATINGNTLTLNFVADQFGNAIITVEAISNGATVQDEFEVIVSNFVAIGDEKISNELFIYPNPSRGLFNLEYLSRDVNKFIIRIHDVLGRSIYFNKFEKYQDKFTKEIDISQFGDGTYFIQIIKDQNILVNKILIVN